MRRASCKYPMRVALTGTIGAGKSTVAAVFADLGVPIYNSDLEARKLMDVALQQDVTALLGAEAYTAEGFLNRPYVASLVFADPQLLASLNSIIHPAVVADFEEWANGQTAPYVIVETALLLESRLVEHIDKVVLVDAPVEICIERAAARDGATREQICARMASQTSQKRLETYAQALINTAPSNLILPQIVELHHNFLY